MSWTNVLIAHLQVLLTPQADAAQQAAAGEVRVEVGGSVHAMVGTDGHGLVVADAAPAVRGCHIGASSSSKALQQLRALADSLPSPVAATASQANMNDLD